MELRCVMFFFFKQKTAYEIKECDWSSDVCSSDLKNNLKELAVFKNYEKVVESYKSFKMD